MNITLLHLNIAQGKYLDRIISYIKKENFDILNFQEVTGGRFSPLRLDCFGHIISALGYRGEIAIGMQVENDVNSYYGNATFFKKPLFLEKKEVLWLKDYQQLASPDKIQWKSVPRNVLCMRFVANKIRFWSFNTHIAWSNSPTDTAEKLRQGKLLYDKIKTIQSPFILSGDFNVSKTSQIVTSLDSLARNLIKENNIINTLNPRLHRIKHLFPEGLVVDFVYTEKSIRVRKFQVINENLSDHLGLYLKFEI